MTMDKPIKNNNAIVLLLMVAGIAVLGILLVPSLIHTEPPLPPKTPADQHATETTAVEASPAEVFIGSDDSGSVAPPVASSPVPATQPKAAAVPSRRVSMPWETWPKPQLAFILTGEQHGFFEPCGCTSSQLGGMSRRANLVQKMTDAGWSVRGLDVGGLSRRSVRESQIKFETTVAALKLLKYIAIGIGPEELRLRPDFLLTQHITDGDSPLYFLSANLEFYGVPDLGTPLPSAVVEASDLKIGVTSVMSEELKKLILPFPDVTWKDPVPELKKVVEEFAEQKVDLRFLLSQSTVEESMALAEQFPQFQIVLTAEGTGDPDPAAPPQKVGNTLLIETGRKGKYVGVLGVYPDDRETPFRYQLVALERDDFDETPAMINLMRNFQDRLKDEKIVLADAISAPHPSGSTFVGADKCGECHTSAYKIWQQTPHAHALDSLDPVHKRIGFERLNGINRMHDPECLSCHVTGWDPQEYIRFRSGFLNSDLAADPAEKTLHKLLAGSQCENCHGPGSQHIELVEAGSDDAGKSVRVTVEEAKAGTCEKCHDADNSPKFEFGEYWDRVKHNGLD
jgi:hypothetical protein